MAILKTQPNDQKVVAFLNSIENEARRSDCLTLLPLFEQWTKEKPQMWGPAIVGFGSYHYRYDSGREGDWFLTGFSPRKQNLTLYIMAGFSQYDTIMQTLGNYKTGSSCLYVKRLSDIDLHQLRQLVEGSVAYMKTRYR